MTPNSCTIIGAPVSFRLPATRNIAALRICSVQSTPVTTRDRRGDWATVSFHLSINVVTGVSFLVIGELYMTELRIKKKAASAEVSQAAREACWTPRG